MAKRKGFRIFIHGTDFVHTPDMVAEFNWNGTVQIREPLVFKNKCLLAS